MENTTEFVKSELPNGITIQIQAKVLGGDEYVAFDILPFQSVADAIEGIAESVVASLEKVKPRYASVEFGIEVGIESGKLTALIVQGTGTANLKITLGWGEQPS